MMLRTTALLSLLLAAVSATPALVWKSSSSSEIGGSTVHTSEEVKVTDLLSGLDSSGISVVFLLARGEDGSESLTATAPLLQQVSAKHEKNCLVHHHVSGIQSGASMVSDASKLGYSPLLVSLHELELKLNESEAVVAALSAEMDIAVVGGATIMTKTEFKQSKRARALSAANMFVVNVAAHTAPERLDAAVVQAMEHSGVAHVILSAVRSTDEVKHERNVLARRRLVAQEKAYGGGTQQSSGRRRLDQAAAEGDDAAAAGSSDLNGVYYVAMTPNILAGILFFLLFATVVWTGIACMGMISGQEIFVTKMPSIGREA